uniref:Uncharacterized protein n=1 Tax=Aegilops tauschii subsp. strangulata TaxID=200361 RepID=A0A453FTB7_AEGTS
MSTSPRSPPPVDAGDGHEPTADELAAAAAATATAEHPRAALTTDTSQSSNLPLTTSPPNLTFQVPLSVPNAPVPSSGLPSSITGLVGFKLALDGTNFTRWRNYLNLLFARYHAESHVRPGAAVRLSDPAWKDDDNTILLWLFSTITGDLLDIVAPPGSTALTIWTRLHE